MYSGGQSMGMFCRHRCKTCICAARRPAHSSSKALPQDPGLSREGRAAGGEEMQKCQNYRCKCCDKARGPWWAGLGIPTPRLLAFSCRNFRNLVRKMYLEASPFGGRKAKAVMS